MDVTQFYLSLVVGLVLGLLIEEYLGVICGGAIVSGYLAMICDDILSVIVVFVISLATYLIVEFVLPKFLILYGRRRFVACILVALVLKILSDLLVPTMPFATLAFRGAGVMSPGLIASNSAKQGLHITIPATLISAYVTFGIVQLIMLAF